MFESDFTKLESEKLIELARIIDVWENPRYIEIGVFSGGSFVKVLDNTNKTECLGIDLFEDFKENSNNTHVTGTVKILELTNKIIERNGADRFRLVKNNSVNVLHQFLGSDDSEKDEIEGMILVDGNHKFYSALTDFVFSYNILKVGYILMHNASNNLGPDVDYVKCDGGPYEVVKLAEKFPGIKYLGTFDRLAVLSKKCLKNNIETCNINNIMKMLRDGR